MLRFYIYVFVFMFSQSALSALDDCPASSGVISAGNGYCIVSSVTTGTKIRLNFSTGFDSTTLIEDDIAAPTKTDAVYASHGITLSKAVDVAEASALASKASGNNGETVGAQRKISFIKAAEIIADQIVSTETIIVDAQFTNLDCSANQAVLGSASATSFMYAASAPAGADDNTWYPVGLYNALSGIDNYPSSGSITNYANNPGSITADSDLFTSYNYASGTNNCLEISNGWYYGFDAPPSEVYQDGVGNHLVDADSNPLAITYIGFTTVLLHEMLHGLGFVSLTYSDGSKFSSKEDIYSNFLYSAADSANWQGNTLSNGQRQSSGISDTGLLWSGANVNAQAIGKLTSGFQNNDGDPAFNSGDRVQMYAPNPVKNGSSISHFNTAASPNEIMEPQYTAGSLDIGLALYLLKDIGWDIVVPSSNTAPSITAFDQSTNEDVAKVVDASSWGGDTDGDTLTYSISSSCATNITCTINSNGTSLTMTPAANHNGGTHTITVTVDDGNGGSANDTFNLNVIAQNDDPVIAGIPNQSVKVGEFKDIVLSGYASDVEGDGLSFTATACGANLTCSFPSSTTIRVAAGAGAGSTVSVTVEADDSNGGTNTDTFDVSITAAAVSNSAPTITAVNQSTNEDIAKVVDASSWGNDTDGDTLTYSINSACATNIICSINSNGTNLTMIPAANHNGGTHSITINVSDGNGGSASDTFNLNVIAQNDAPAITGIPNQTIKAGESKDINLAAYASDIESDGLTFSATACGANLTCTFPSATTIRVAASAGAASTASVTVEVNDSNGGTNTDTFDVSITSSLPSTTVEVGGSAHNDGDTVILSDSSIQINVNNGSGDYSYSLDYNSSDVSSLISSNASGLTIALPTSGEFAGDYTLMITDNGDGDIITITITRPLRLTWSTKVFLNGDVSQTLKVEGGAAGTVYSLVQSGDADLIFRDISDSSVTTATAMDDAVSFNAALVHLDSLVVAAISSMDVTVQSSYDDVIEAGVKVYPSSLHSFTVTNSSGDVLGSAVATLNGAEALLAELGVSTNHNVDANGEFTVLLPDTSALPVGSSYAMSVSLAGYSSASLVLNSESTVHDVVLVELTNGITLIGNINAQGSQNLLQQAPVVTISYGDGTAETISVAVTSATRASFSHEVDLNLKSLNLLSISQAESVTVDLNMSNVSQSQNLDIFLLNNVSIVATKPVDTTPGSSGGAAGSLIWFNLFLFAALLFRFLLLKRRELEAVQI